MTWFYYFLYLLGLGMIQEGFNECFVLFSENGKIIISHHARSLSLFLSLVDEKAEKW